MMNMVLNNNTNEVIEIASFSRYFDLQDEKVRFRLDLGFSENYSSDSIEFLANYAKKEITSIVINNSLNENVLNLNGLNARLTSLTETCSNESRYANATITAYEADAD